MRRQLQSTAPKFTALLDKSIERAGDSFEETLKIIDKRTEKERVGLLKAYRSFLMKQVAIIDSKTRRIEGKDSSSAEQKGT